MVKKFTDEEYLNAKSSDYLIFECENCKEDFRKQKRFLKSSLNLAHPHKFAIRFCSKKCEHEKRKAFFVEKKCSNCLKTLLTQPHLIKKSKSGNVFCSKSCSASFNNRNKKTGTRRSKLEVWIEEELRKFYKFEIIFNGKDAINSELDIYIPSLRLAFELNGIFHYEPIYGIDKLAKVKDNDSKKFQSCIENKIELHTIDTSDSEYFKPDRDIKYLNIIKNIINGNI